MALKVGCIPYLQYEPFYFDMERRGIKLIELRPSEIAAAAERGDIDAAPVPLIDSLQLEDRFQLVGQFGIVGLGKSQNVFLHSTQPIEVLDGVRIGITDEAATSPDLLRLILSQKHALSPPTYVTLQEPHDAFVQIGNRGLRQRKGAQGFDHTYDLNEVWQTWTGLPFVWSRWMVQQDVDPSEIALLQDTLYIGLEEGVNLLYQASEPRPHLLMRPRDITQFIRNYRFTIGLSEQQAIDRFRQGIT